MNELARLLIRYMPRYATEFISFMFHPKSFLYRTREHPDNALLFALAFFVVSTFGQLFLTFTVLFHVDLAGLAIKIVNTGMVSFVGLALLSFSVYLGWHAVGGRGKVRDVFVAIAYFMGTMGVIASLLLMVGSGVTVAFAPRLQTCMPIRVEVPAECYPKSAGELYVYIALLCIYFICILVPLGWLVSMWGYFRSLYEASKLRSLSAFCLAMLTAAPLGFVISLIYASLHGNIVR